MNLSNLQKRLFTSIILLSLILLIFSYNLALVYFLIIFGVLSILEFIQLIKKIKLKIISQIFINFIFISYIFIFTVLFFSFVNLSNLKILLFILLLGCVASDIGGFIFGKIIKGPKLTRISPNKTYAGVAGSFVLSILLIFLLFNYYMQIFSYNILVVAVVTSIFCQLGDLFFSFLKRKAKLKDTGKIIPGHGGVLDRLDGILLGIPFGFITIILLN